jgi:hypothetical protein
MITEARNESTSPKCLIAHTMAQMISRPKNNLEHLDFNLH